MNVEFQQFSENQSNTLENDEMNYYENIEKLNIKTEVINNISTQSNNGYLAAQELKIKTVKNDENINIKVSNSHLSPSSSM